MSNLELKGTKKSLSRQSPFFNWQFSMTTKHIVIIIKENSTKISYTAFIPSVPTSIIYINQLQLSINQM